MTTTYSNNSTYSHEVLTTLRANLRECERTGEATIVCGSFSRHEASTESDIDYFTVRTTGDNIDKVHEEDVRCKIQALVPKGPADGGAFSRHHRCDEIIHNIGGQDDSNDTITRRVLFLLEGTWISGEELFRELRKDVLKKYIKPVITDHQLALFLLNDVIRYYRTIAVDYEFKTAEASTPKPWAIRNLKLIFSRKLLYASGLFSIALTCDRRYEEKIRILEQLFDIPCMDRLREICGQARTEKLLDYYSYFLAKISDHKIRDHLEQLKLEERSTDHIFRDIKNEGHCFTHELQALFETSFDATHPIHRAVVF